MPQIIVFLAASSLFSVSWWIPAVNVCPTLATRRDGKEKSGHDSYRPVYTFLSLFWFLSAVGHGGPTTAAGA